jgi:hypothetical protein
MVVLGLKGLHLQQGSAMRRDVKHRRAQPPARSTRSLNAAPLTSSRAAATRVASTAATVGDEEGWD